MQNDRSYEIFTYWDSLRRGGAAPFRSAVQPSALGKTLPDLFILKAEGPYLRFRLAGTRMCDRLGGELRGSLFDDLWEIKSADTAAEAVLAALRTERAMIASVIGTDIEGIETAFEMLFLPLKSSNLLTERILGSFLPSDKQQMRGTICTLRIIDWRPVLENARRSSAYLARQSVIQRLLSAALEGKANRADPLN
ncbi:PAS domain-containing protein [Rhizobium oryzicola]|uniref:PAS domain-containing protein n=1 Tax=Rhizobium oryzicola TaxID=1232668 RepID=A0ABT8SZC7_9HYPH|nr:PAS domain-containing protein [Rhizobium oryzicola]MDO1583726.1 PAS domain-containing protein [Rhizobium oryzicola]